MTKSIKQEAYTTLGKFLQTDNGSLVFGYNKNYEVTGVARTKEQLKEVIQTKGIAGVIFPMTQPHATGYDFVTGEKYKTLKGRAGDIKDYTEKENHNLYEYSTNIDEMIRENTNFIEPFMEFLDKIDASYGCITEQPVSGHNSTYEAVITLSGCRVRVSKHGTVVTLSPNYLVVHDSTKDTDINFYSTFMARVLNVDENIMKDVLVKCLQNKG